MKINKATVVTGNGPDHIFLRTDLKEATYPFIEKLDLRFTAAAGTGATYLKNNFDLTDHEIEIVSI